jgi:hypothetical protein
MPVTRAPLVILSEAKDLLFLAILALGTLACVPRPYPSRNAPGPFTRITFETPYPVELSYVAAGASREAVSYERVTALHGYVLQAFNDTVIVAVSYLTLESADPDREGPTIRVAAIYGSPTAVIVMTPAVHIKEIAPRGRHSRMLTMALLDIAFCVWYIKFDHW